MAKKDISRLKPIILVVDDYEGIRDTFEAILKDDYCTLKAEDGKKALEIMSKRRL